MLISALALSLAALPGDGSPVTLNRVFARGEKITYEVKSNLHSETRVYGTPTWMPDDFDLSYKTVAEVREMKADGIAVVRYTRPSMVEVEADDGVHGQQTKTEKLDWILELTVSPINELLAMKDLNPKKDKKKPKKTDDGDGYFRSPAPSAYQQFAIPVLASFVQEVHSVALNVGSLDNSLELSPKLPFDEVKVGDTWKKTVGYQPQKLKGSSGKTVVQRLDYTFTYKGVVTVGGKPFYRVNASLDLNTDLNAFLADAFGAKTAQTHIKSVPLTLKQSIDYDLDMKTKRTVSAHSASEGGFAVNITDLPAESLQEEKFTGTTDLRLASVSVAAPAKPVKKGH